MKKVFVVGEWVGSGAGAGAGTLVGAGTADTSGASYVGMLK